MNIEALKIFVEVMRRGDYSSVAKDRDLSPSSISRTIASLEKQLGVRLFQRTTRSLSPTEAGKLYFKRVEPVVEELEYARLVVVDSTKNLSGTIRITASPLTWCYLYIPPANRIHQTSPRSNCRLTPN